MYSNGNSFSNGQSMGNGRSMLWGERRNTEPWHWRLLCQVQQGAVA